MSNYTGSSDDWTCSNLNGMKWINWIQVTRQMTGLHSNIPNYMYYIMFNYGQSITNGNFCCVDIIPFRHTIGTKV